MKGLKLSRRLRTVAEQIPAGTTMADIGSDHAAIPCFTCRQEVTRWAIASEVAQGPYQRTCHQVQQSGLEECIDVRLGSGLEILDPNEVDVVIMAGMGGELIVDMLEAGQDLLIGISRLVLQPNVARKTVRRWLLRHDWALVNEAIIEEYGKFYEVLVAEPGDGQSPYQGEGELELELEAGPLLIQQKSPVFLRKWRHERLKKKNIYNQLLQASPTENIANKKQRLLREINEMEEMLK